VTIKIIMSFSILFPFIALHSLDHVSRALPSSEPLGFVCWFIISSFFFVCVCVSCSFGEIRLERDGSSRPSTSFIRSLMS
jgi:hypothetical protein